MPYAPAAPAAPAASVPTPPLNVPINPAVSSGRRTPFSYLMHEAMRLNLTDIAQKLYVLVGHDENRYLIIEEVVTAAGISEDELATLMGAPRNILSFSNSDNSGIFSNGVPVQHVHGSNFMARSGPARPLVIRTNGENLSIKYFA